MASIQEIQQTELALLKCCRDVCERHDIEYYLAFGTLLGAVRHKGFIPWDDDVDIMMPAEQIETFKKYFIEEAPREYFFADAASEPHALITWLKVRNTETTSMPKKFMHIPINWGICIDIFPLYNASEKSLKRALFLFGIANKMLSVPALVCEDGPSLTDRLLARLPLSLRRYIAKRAVSRLERQKNGGYRFDGWELVANDVLGGGKETLVFEGEEFRVPSNWHKLLTDVYGDYMTPPPEDERGGHDLEIGDILWSTTKSYQEYKQESKKDASGR